MVILSNKIKKTVLHLCWKIGILFLWPFNWYKTVFILVLVVQSNVVLNRCKLRSNKKCLLTDNVKVVLKIIIWVYILTNAKPKNSIVRISVGKCNCAIVGRFIVIKKLYNISSIKMTKTVEKSPLLRHSLWNAGALEAKLIWLKEYF